LTDSRTPTAHNQAWSTITGTPTTLSGYGITDAVGSSDARLSDARTPTSHAHGNITSSGAIGSTSGQIVVTTTGGALTTAATISSSQVSGLGSLATQSGTFTGTSSGTNTGDQTITLTGDVTGSGSGSFAATLSNSGVAAGTYRSVTVDAKGRVTAGTNPSGGVSIGLLLALS
jgi:phage-related tail fiber protein